MPTVPAAAVIATDSKAIVWRERSRGVFEKVNVTLGTQMGDRVAVLAGLNEGDRVVVDGVMLLSGN